MTKMRQMTAKQISDRWDIPFLIGVDNTQAWKDSFLALGTATIELDRIKEEQKDIVNALLHYQNLADTYFKALNAIQTDHNSVDVQDYIDGAHEEVDTT
jgi:hypothetical protein